MLDYSKEYIIQACESSLKRLQRDTIDYYQLHSARMPHLENGECIEAMELLKQQGKIRYWGLSLTTFSPEHEANFLMQHHIADGFQLVFNIINQKALPIIEKASEKGYGIIARMPLQFGLLTGKFSSDTTFSHDDHRSFRLTPEILQHTLNVLEEKVWPMANALGMTPTALALSFILSYPQISTCIPGIRTPQHVDANTKGLQPLSAAHKKALHELSANEWRAVMSLLEKAG